MSKNNDVVAVEKLSNEMIYDLFNEGETRLDVTELPVISIIHAAQLFELPDGSTKKEIDCILLDTYRSNAYYSNPDVVEGAMPDCWAVDYKKGDMKPDIGCENPQSDLCSSCHMNEWNTDPKGGGGKACKNGRRIIIMIKDYYVPCILALPPTSMKNFEKYLNSFVVKHIPYQAVSTKIQLDKKENYSVIKASTDGTYETDVNKLKNIKNIILEFKDLMYRKPTQDNTIIPQTEE